MNSPFLASAMLRVGGSHTDSFKPLSSGPAERAARGTPLGRQLLGLFDPAIRLGQGLRKP
jgi:hypothetical protein